MSPEAGQLQPQQPARHHGSVELLLASLSPSGRDFELLCKWLLENVPQYRSRLDRVWLWADWPGRKGRADAGIDLVAQEHSGSLWAVQAKHYGPLYAIRKADVDSFLSESSRSDFTYRLLIATTDKVGRNARSTIEFQAIPVGMILRSDLATLEVEWPRSIEQLVPSIRAPKTPRPHQQRAVADVVSGLVRRDRGQLLMACGTGKTLAARFLHDALGAQRTLVLVPSLSLVKQTIREWFSVGDLDYLAVCSDDTVSLQERDAVVASKSELGVPVTTDPAEIAAFLRETPERSRVVFATYQSSQRIADAQARSGTPHFDLVVADEAHRCAGPEAGVFATVLDPGKIRAGKRIFMTATPRYFTGKRLREASESDWELASMDDDEKFGPELHRLTFAQAIEQDLLSDYRVVVVGVSDSSYRDLAERGVFVTADGNTVTDARTLASQLGLLRAMRNHDLRRVVSFHSRIQGARTFAASLPDVSQWMPPRRRPTGELWAQHVSGEMTSGERETRLNELRDVGEGKRGLLTNARCLTEGVDVPTLDGVAFIDPRSSQVDIVQAVGRVMRKTDAGTVGTIVIPVFVDENADPEQALAASEFNRVWDVVKALRAHDDVLAEELDHFRRQLGRRTTGRTRPTKLEFDLPAGVGAAFARAFDTRVVETTTASWEQWFGLLERYLERERDTRVPQGFLEDGFRLGQWVSGQRGAQVAGRLAAARAERLEALPGWTWNTLDAAWEEGFASLTRYAERVGDTRVPEGFLEDGFRLGQWVAHQRGAQVSGRLAAGRAERLEALPGWTWDAHGAAWEEGFASLTRYAERVGDTRVPARFLEDGFRLGQWVSGQRSAQVAGRLSAARAERLKALPGWTWSTLDAAWEEGFASLTRYAERVGDTRVPKGFREDGFRLGQWVSGQRGAQVAGRLAAARAERLEALPGWTWSTRTPT